MNGGKSTANLPKQGMACGMSDHARHIMISH